MGKNNNVFNGEWSPSDAWAFQGIDENNKCIEIKMSGQEIYDRIFFLKDRIEKLLKENKESDDIFLHEVNQDRILRHLRAINELKMVINRPDL